MNVAPHKSEAVFRRYELALGKIVDEWPTVQIFDPTPFSPETFSCGIRRAIASLKDYRWPTAIGIDRVLQLSIVVSATVIPSKVVAGPIKAIRALAPNKTALTPNVILPPTSPSSAINLTDPPADLLQAVITLHHYRLLPEPSTIHFSIGIPPEIDLYLSGKDIFVEYNEETKTYTVT